MSGRGKGASGISLNQPKVSSHPTYRELPLPGRSDTSEVMPSDTNIDYMAEARQKLSALVDEAAAERSRHQRSELRQRIRLAEELLQVATQQESCGPALQVHKPSAR